MIRYICTKACFYRNRLWKRGEELSAAKGDDVPAHFELYTAPLEAKKEPEEPLTFSALQKKEAKEMLSSVGHGEQAPQEPEPAKKKKQEGKAKASREMFD